MGLAGRFLARLGIKFSSAKWRFGCKIQSVPGSAGRPAEAENPVSMQPAAAAIPSIRPPEMHLPVPGFPRSVKSAGLGPFRRGFDPIRAYLLRKPGYPDVTEARSHCCIRGPHLA